MGTKVKEMILHLIQGNQGDRYSRRQTRIALVITETDQACGNWIRIDYIPPGVEKMCGDIWS